MHAMQTARLTNLCLALSFILTIVSTGQKSSELLFSWVAKKSCHGQTTLYNVCAVPWGVFSIVGDIISTVGGYLEYRGVFSTVGGYHDKCGGIS